MKPNCITIYTDASWCQETKIGAWGCWIKYGPGSTINVSSAFKKVAHNSLLAELWAIANSISVALKNAPDQEYTHLIVVTDCQGAQQYIERAKLRSNHLPGMGKKRLDKECLESAKCILNLIPDGLELRANKVKAHSNKDGKRSYINNLVDRAAKAKMRAARKVKK